MNIVFIFCLVVVAVSTQNNPLQKHENECLEQIKRLVYNQHDQDESGYDEDDFGPALESLFCPLDALFHDLVIHADQAIIEAGNMRNKLEIENAIYRNPTVIHAWDLLEGQVKKEAQLNNDEDEKAIIDELQKTIINPFIKSRISKKDEIRQNFFVNILGSDLLKHENYYINRIEGFVEHYFRADVRQDWMDHLVDIFQCLVKQVDKVIIKHYNVQEELTILVNIRNDPHVEQAQKEIEEQLNDSLKRVIYNTIIEPFYITRVGMKDQVKQKYEAENAVVQGIAPRTNFLGTVVGGTIVGTILALGSSAYERLNSKDGPK